MLKTKFYGVWRRSGLKNSHVTHSYFFWKSVLNVDSLNVIDILRTRRMAGMDISHSTRVMKPALMHKYMNSKFLNLGKKKKDWDQLTCMV
ncbi:hypothetical protein TcWFU_008424 [Taenia crassiceps]|uniref:Uncharacterized protein n=1 Tax=Taenia crassiceps TaxID=6207 RepID=A0ABR4QT22_9CEST